MSTGFLGFLEKYSNSSRSTRIKIFDRIIWKIKRKDMKKYGANPYLIIKNLDICWKNIITWSTINVWLAIIIFPNIIHDIRPGIGCETSYQRHHSVEKILEIHIIVDDLAFLHIFEHITSDHSINGQSQEKEKQDIFNIMTMEIQSEK